MKFNDLPDGAYFIFEERISPKATPLFRKVTCVNDPREQQGMEYVMILSVCQGTIVLPSFKQQTAEVIEVIL